MKRIICTVIAIVSVIMLTCCARADAGSVVSSVSDFASQQKFKLSMNVKQSYTDEGKEFNFEKKYTKLACDTVLGYEYYEQSGTLYLNGEDKGTQFASYYPPMRVLSLNDTVTTEKEYKNYISASDMLFFRTDIITPTKDDIKGADISESDGVFTYMVSSPSGESLRALSEYIGSDVENAEFSYTLKDGRLISYTQKYDIVGSTEMHIELTADIEATGDDVEKYDDGEIPDDTNDTDTAETDK